MDSRITSLIDLAVESGEITSKQREIIYTKAKELGIEEMEVDIFIDSKITQVNNAKDKTDIVNSRNGSLDLTNSSKKKRHLYKNKEEGKLSGVCAGLGDYFNISPTLIRCFFVLTCSFTIVAYIVLAISMPTEEQISI